MTSLTHETRPFRSRKLFKPGKKTTINGKAAFRLVGRNFLDINLMETSRKSYRSGAQLQIMNFRTLRQSGHRAVQTFYQRRINTGQWIVLTSGPSFAQIPNATCGSYLVDFLVQPLLSYEVNSDQRRRGSKAFLSKEEGDESVLRSWDTCEKWNL